MARKVKRGGKYFSLPTNVFMPDSEFCEFIDYFGGYGLNVYEYIMCDIKRTGYYYDAADITRYATIIAKRLSSEKDRDNVLTVIDYLYRHMYIEILDGSVFTSAEAQIEYAESKIRYCKSIESVKGDYWILTPEEDEAIDGHRRKDRYKSERNQPRSEGECQSSKQIEGCLLEKVDICQPGDKKIDICQSDDTPESGTVGYVFSCPLNEFYDDRAPAFKKTENFVEAGGGSADIGDVSGKEGGLLEKIDICQKNGEIEGGLLEFRKETENEKISEKKTEKNEEKKKEEKSDIKEKNKEKKIKKTEEKRTEKQKEEKESLSLKNCDDASLNGKERQAVINTARAREEEGGRDMYTAEDFKNQFRIVYDVTPGADTDFKALQIAYMHSPDFLMIRSACRYMSWIEAHSDKILAGYYDTWSYMAGSGSADILQELYTKYRREEEKDDTQGDDGIWN